jgi:FkbM family methyltransferase
VEGFLVSEEFAKRYTEPPDYVVTDYGFGIHVDAQDRDIGAVILEKRMYEPHVTAALGRELQSSNVFLDVGANVGWFSLLAARILGEGRVLAVEPNPKNLQLLYASICRNEMSNITVYPYAASEVARLLGMESVGSNGFVTGVSTARSGRTYVQGIRLDDLLRHEPRIDVVKLDIEGHEPFALRGMTDLLTLHRPVVYTEFHPKAMKDNFGRDGREYLQALVSLGYHLAVLGMDGVETQSLMIDDVLDHWRRHNRALGMLDEAHIDLACRPR